MAEIRELRSEERRGAVALWEAAGLTRPWNDPEADFDRALGSPSSAVLGSFDGSGLVATAMVGYDGHRGWVYYLACEAELVGAGLGRRMMAAAEEWLIGRGAVKINVMVRDTNPAALEFYARLGYEEVGSTVLGRRMVHE